MREFIQNDEGGGDEIINPPPVYSVLNSTQ